MNKPVGGRGKKAPYETEVIRVPVPIIPQVEKMIEDYRVFVINGEVSKEKVKSDIPSEFSQITYSEALQEAKRISKHNKSANESMAKLLQVLYGGTVRKEDLK